MSEKSWNQFGIVVGGMMCFIGLMVFLVSFITIEDTGFGGDFYTYQYHATRIASINIGSSFGLLFIFIGLLTIVHYGKALTILSNSEAKSIDLTQDTVSILEQL